MALFSRLRPLHLHRRLYSSSSILSSDSGTPLTAKEKTRAALALLKSETNPDRILQICRAAALTPESHMDRIAFSVAIKKLTESSYFEGIRQFLDELKTRPDLKTERYAAHAMVLFGQAKMIDHAIRTFEEMDQLGIPRSVYSLNSLLFSCIMARDFKQMNRIYVDFPRIYNIKPNLDTYATVIKGFSESGSSMSAYSVLTEMDSVGVKPNKSIFGAMLAGFYKEGKNEDIEKVLELMKKYEVPHGVTTYNSRIQSLCKLKKSSEAKALLTEMQSKGVKPNASTYCNLIHGYCKEGNLEEAKSLFKSMVRVEKPDSECYFTLVHFLCEGKDYESALEICKESIAKGWFPRIGSMISLANGLASVSKVAEARELIGQVKQKFSKNVERWDELEASLPE